MPMVGNQWVDIAPSSTTWDLNKLRQNTPYGGSVSYGANNPWGVPGTFYNFDANARQQALQSNLGVGGSGGGGAYSGPASLTTQTVENLTPEQQTVLKQTLSGELYSPQSTTDYYNQAIKPEMEDARMRALRDVTAQYSGPGYWGSSRAVAQERVNQDALNQQNRTLATLMFNQDAAKKKAMQDALGVKAFDTMAYWNPNTTAVSSY